MRSKLTRPTSLSLLDLPLDLRHRVDGVREHQEVGARLAVRHLDDHRARVELRVVLRVRVVVADEEALGNRVQLNAVDRIALRRAARRTLEAATTPTTIAANRLCPGRSTACGISVRDRAPDANRMPRRASSKIPESHAIDATQTQVAATIARRVTSQCGARARDLGSQLHAWARRRRAGPRAVARSNPRSDPVGASRSTRPHHRTRLLLDVGRLERPVPRAAPR